METTGSSSTYFRSPFSHVHALPQVVTHPVETSLETDEDQFLNFDRRYSISDVSTCSPLLGAPSPFSRASGSMSPSGSTSSQQRDAEALLALGISLDAQSQEALQHSLLPCGGHTHQSVDASAALQQQQTFTFVPVNHLFGDASFLPTLPPMQQIERSQVTSDATLLASSRRRTSPAKFACPVPNCNATFTRRFNLRGHLRSHAEQRPFICGWTGCGKSFSRAHDCKRHETLHCSKAPYLLCDGCGKPFSRSDSLRRHWRSDGGKKCRERGDAAVAEQEAYESLLESIGLP